MRRNVLFLLFLLLSQICLAQSSTKLADLRVYAQKKDWLQILDKASQVSEGERKTEWTKLVVQAADQHLEYMRFYGEDVSEAIKPVAKIGEIQQKYPFLLKDPTFQAAKFEVIDRLSDPCMREKGTGCISALDTLTAGLTNYPPRAAQTLGYLYSVQKQPGQALWFWSQAVGPYFRSCVVLNLRKDLIAMLDTPTPREIDLKSAKKVLDQCLKDLEAELIRAIEKSTSQPNLLAQRVCPVLLARNRSSEKKKLCDEKAGPAK